jgi:phenol 2-monooxygenase
MLGDTTDAVWGVMDIYAKTNFPDIRKKTVIHSSSQVLLLIPREDDNLVRFYIEQPQGVPAVEVNLNTLHDSLRAILKPYSLEIVETVWWSTYCVGQRLADRFHKDYRVFLAGDACHTHSPKAGQGMNVSMQDGYNIGWKLGAVLCGKAVPQLLETYLTEREVTAADLIEFDLHLSQLFSSKYCTQHNISTHYFQAQFVRARQFAAGLATKYWSSLVVSQPSEGDPALKGVVVGMRFPSAQVVRFADARAMQLLQALPSDCRWRLIVFAGDIQESSAATRLGKVWFPPYNTSHKPCALRSIS